MDRAGMLLNDASRIRHIVAACRRGSSAARNDLRFLPLFADQRARAELSARVELLQDAALLIEHLASNVITIEETA